MPLIHSFKATTIRNAFILNSLASTITIVVAILLKNEYNQYFENHANGNVKKIEQVKLTFSQIVTLMFITFLTSMITYTLLYFLFGFGGGMLSPTD